MHTPAGISMHFHDLKVCDKLPGKTTQHETRAAANYEMKQEEMWGREETFSLPAVIAFYVMQI